MALPKAVRLLAACAATSNAWSLANDAPAVAADLHDANPPALIIKADAHHNDTKVITTGSLTEGQVESREHLYGAIIAVASASLLLGGVMVFFVRTRAKNKNNEAATKRGLSGDAVDYIPVPVAICAVCDRAWKDGEKFCPECGNPRRQEGREIAGKGLGGVDADEVEEAPAEMSAAELETKRSAWVHMQEEKKRGQYAAYLSKRWWVLFLLFFLYVGVSVGLPYAHAPEATCIRGFFWEVHMQFLAVFVLTKMVELWLCANDPTVDFGNISLLQFLLRFLPSFFGYVDAYTDATGTVIAHACPHPIAQLLSMLMFGNFVIGVLFLQWTFMFVQAARDPSQACFLKLLHMDLLASMITLPKEQKPVWDRLAMMRTFGEDVPQAILQLVYLIKVKKNFFMLTSVLIAVASSFKAMQDARHRALEAEAAKEAFENRERSTEIYSCSQDRTIRCWNAETAECKKVMDAPSPVNKLVAVSGTLFSAHDDGYVREWSLDTGEIIHELENPGDGGIIGGTPEKLYGWARPHYGSTQTIKEWSVVTREKTAEFGELKMVGDLYVCGKKLYSNGLQAEEVAEWNLENHQMIREFKGHEDTVCAIWASKKRLLTGSDDHTLREWSLQTGDCTRKFSDFGGLHHYPLSNVHVYKTMIFYPAHDKSDIHVVSLETGEPLMTLSGHNRRAIGMTTLAGKLYSCGVDHTIREWNLETGQTVRSFEGHTNEVFRLIVQFRDSD